ncbi:MAG TPA: hypothetical protein PLV68_00105 [Ilumatobacteraceae bacterium]|nr:hypothetical protein [Ilumatobacteraceae bacterium]
MTSAGRIGSPPAARPAKVAEVIARLIVADIVDADSLARVREAKKANPVTASSPNS